MTLIAELSQIELMISRLPYRERLWLIERLAQQLREEWSDQAAQPGHVWEPASAEAAAKRGERLLQMASQNQALWEAGMAAAMKELGISGEPIGAEKVQEMIAACGVNPEDNEFSRGIVEMREE
jgi:hypothetical protein